MISQPATQVRWSIQDIEGLPKNEWTTYEIIDGELFVTRSPHRRHQQIAHEICSALNIWSKQSRLGEAIFSPGVILSDADNVIPDVIWLTQERLAVIEDEAGHLRGMPELVVEVLSSGDSNIRRDREAKLKLYSVQGAQEYWIADRFLKQLEVYRREEGRLSLKMTLAGNDVLTSLLLPGFSCEISQFFL